MLIPPWRSSFAYEMYTTAVCTETPNSARKPMPPIGDAVPSKQVAITSCPRPSTSKICAPQ